MFAPGTLVLVLKNTRTDSLLRLLTAPLFNMVVCFVPGQVYSLASHPRLPFTFSKQSEVTLLCFPYCLEELKRQTQRLVGTSLTLKPSSSSIYLSTTTSSMNCGVLRMTNGSLVQLLSVFSL